MRQRICLGSDKAGYVSWTGTAGSKPATLKTLEGDDYGQRRPLGQDPHGREVSAAGR